LYVYTCELKNKYEDASLPHTDERNKYNGVVMYLISLHLK